METRRKSYTLFLSPPLLSSLSNSPSLTVCLPKASPHKHWVSFGDAKLPSYRSGKPGNPFLGEGMGPEVRRKEVPEQREDRPSSSSGLQAPPPTEAMGNGSKHAALPGPSRFRGRWLLDHT